MIRREQLDAMAMDWDEVETQFYQINVTELDCEGDATSMLCTISPYASKEYAEMLGELAFETFETKWVYFTNP